MNLIKKTLIAAAIAGTAISAQAGEFYIDLTGTGVGNGAGSAFCPDCTSAKTQADFSYTSSTEITLSDPTKVSVGDAIVTTGGLDLGDLNASFDTNRLSGFLPGSFSKGFTNDRSTGDNTDWGLSFTINLTGSIADVNATGTVVNDVQYDSGLIEVYLMTFDGAGNVAAAQNIMDLTVTGSNSDNPSNFIVEGLVSYGTGAPEVAALADMFHYVGKDCGGDNSFQAIAGCSPPMKVTFELDQNLDNVAAVFGAPGTATLTGDHNGSIEFNVPEPATLLLMGGVLAGFGATRRKKA